MKNNALKILPLVILVQVLFLAACKSPSTNQKQEDRTKPEIISLGMASPDALVLGIRARWVEHGTQIPYERLPGDSIIRRIQHRYIWRDGEMIGSLAGKEDNILFTPDRIYGDTLDTDLSDNPVSYEVRQGKKKIAILAVNRKTKPFDYTRAPARETHTLDHTLVLKLSEPLTEGKKYTVHFPEGIITVDKKSFVFDPASLRSEAVHVNQVGFRPDDPVKLAFLSFWTGTGGGLEYPEGLPFRLLDEKTGEEVFSGKAVLSKPAGDSLGKTYADIHELDFSAFDTPGLYRISVEGVGCSFPFPIGEEVWKDAFVKSMRGLFCQRSGIALGPPYTDFVRPRGFHPDDGMKVYVSEPRREGEDTTLRTLNPELAALVASFQPEGRFQRWVDDLIDKEIPNAWGGYMDAGDWDRRPDHALMPLMMFDLEEMFPETFRDWTFNIPESGDELPDLINEALWKVDFLKRMQQEDGSVYAGIESASHPRRGETSWQESLPVFAYSRTRNSAYNYVADGARAALWFRSNNMAERADAYLESALRAYAWAEGQPEEQGRGFGFDRGAGARCLAAAEMYRLTGEDQYHDVFLATTRFTDPEAPFYTSPMGPNGDAQGEAGWTYLRTSHPGVNKEIQENIRHAMLRDADRMVENTYASDFHWAGGPRRLISWGAMSMPESHLLCRAHFMSGKEEYLKAIVLSALSGAGANPVNMCFVTGVGTNWPQHPLHEDAYITHQPLYEGITIGGPQDPNAPNKQPNYRRVAPMLYPAPAEWPPAEAYFDVWVYAPMNEYTVHQTMLPTSFVWGYLAARQ